MSQDDKKKDEKSQSPTLVPYMTREQVDREFLDLHGIPYPMPTSSQKSESESKLPSV